MANNASQMTLEERITQRIKDDTLMAVVGDEDAINELVKRALDEALFQPRRIDTKSYRGYEERDSPVIAAAREAAGKVGERIAEKMVEHLMADEEVRKAMLDHMVACVPSLLASGMMGMFDSARLQTESALREKMRRVGIDLPQ